MSSVAKHKDFLSLLLKHKKNPLEVKKLIELASRGEVDACCEIFLNALNGNVRLTPKISRQLHKHRKQCRDLLSKKTGLHKKKKILRGQVGGFLGALLAGLAGPLLNTVVGAIRGRH